MNKKQIVQRSELIVSRKKLSNWGIKKVGKLVSAVWIKKINKKGNLAILNSEELEEKSGLWYKLRVAR